MKFLVAGATGTVGREIVKQLAEAGHDVRALTRNANAVVPDGVEIVVGDLTAPQSFAAALEGIDGLHLITFGGDDFAPLTTGDELMTLAKAAGIKRITLLMGGDHMPIEESIKASGIDWTFVEPVEFMSNHLEWAEPIRTEGVLREPFIERVSALVHEADIAAVAVAALTQPGHGGKTYTLTGPEVLTVRQKVDILGKAIGREIELVELSEQEARERWAVMGFDDASIEFFVTVYGNTPEVGYTVLPTVEQVTGRPARTFAQWAQTHAAAFVA